MTPDINKIIDETIADFVKGDLHNGVNGLRELASAWKGANFPGARKSFHEICEYIVNAATEQCDDPALSVRIRNRIGDVAPKSRIHLLN